MATVRNYAITSNEVNMLAIVLVEIMQKKLIFNCRVRLLFIVSDSLAKHLNESRRPKFFPEHLVFPIVLLGVAPQTG
jgi:hypothetical protein